MNIARSTLIVVTALLAFAPTAPAQELAETQVVSSDQSRVRVLEQIDGPRVMLVKPKIGLSATLGEISSKLDSALETRALTSVEVKEFRRRAGEITEELGAARKDGTICSGKGQTISRELFTLSEDINRRLSPAVAAAYRGCPDGTCSTIDEQAVATQVKQLRRRIDEEVAYGTMTPDEGRRLRQEAMRLGRLGQDTHDQEGLKLASRNLRKLALRVDRDSSEGKLSAKPASSSFLALPRAF